MGYYFEIMGLNKKLKKIKVERRELKKQNKKLREFVNKVDKDEDFIYSPAYIEQLKKL